MLTAIFTLTPTASAQYGHGWGWTNSPERCVEMALPEDPIEVWSCYQPWGTDSTSASIDHTYQHDGPYTDVLYISGNVLHPDYNSGRVVTNRPLRHEGEFLFSVYLGSRYWPGLNPEGKYVRLRFEFRPEGEEDWELLWENEELDPDDHQGPGWHLFDFADRVPAEVNFDWSSDFHDPDDLYHFVIVNASRIEDYQEQAVVSNEEEPPPGQLLTLFPNPTSGLLTIDGQDIKKVLVYDSLGRLVFEQDRGGQLDLSSLPSGPYFILIRTLSGDYRRGRVTHLR